MNEAPRYAFPHSAADESRRLELFEQRLDPLTIGRGERLGIGTGARCLEIGGGRGSITRRLADRVGPTGKVIATDLQTGFLDTIAAENVEVDVIEPGTPLAEVYRLSMAAIGPAAIEAGALTVDEARALVERPDRPDFLGCGFVHIGVGRRPLDA